jgi:hypothetical protein
MIEWTLRIGVALIFLVLLIWLLIVRREIKDEEAKIDQNGNVEAETESAPPGENKP